MKYIQGRDKFSAGDVLFNPNLASSRHPINITNVQEALAEVIRRLPNSWIPLTFFNVGEVVNCLGIPAYCVLECTVAGTSGITEPTGSAVGSTIADGGVTWVVRDRRQGSGVGKIPALIDVGSGVAGLPAVDGSLLTGLVSNGPGWEKYSDGRIMQWGGWTISSTSPAAQITVTFPLTMVEVSTAPVISVFNAAIDQIGYSNVTTSGMKINKGSSDNAARSGSYRVWGWWK